MLFVNKWLKAFNILLILVILAVIGYYYNNIPMKIFLEKPQTGEYFFSYDKGDGYTSENLKIVTIDDEIQIKAFFPASTKNIKLTFNNNENKGLCLSAVKIGRKYFSDIRLQENLILDGSKAQLFDTGEIVLTPTANVSSFHLNPTQEIIKKRQPLILLLGVLCIVASFILTAILGLSLKFKNKLIPIFKTIISSPKSYTWAFFASLGISAFVLLRWIDYPLSDSYGFRQAQTAITSLFMLKEFSFFSYQTPVLGYPWAIPFELPIYQTIVCLLCKVTHLGLTVCGRLISWTFYILTLYPVYKISTKFVKDKTLFYIIGALYLISPIYLFWGRTFMIETTTVFFATMFLYYFIKIVDEGRFLDLMLGLSFSLLCILSKATTYPPFAVAGALYWLYFVFKNKKINYLTLLKLGAIGFISLASAILWVHHSDSVKAQNMIGSLLTSKALVAWNYGTLAQRLSLDTYTTLLFKHIIPFILGNTLGLFLLFASFVLAPRDYKKFFCVFALLFCIPITIFIKLYYVHSYYFSANAIFLIGGIGLLLYGILKSNRKKLTFLLFILIWSLMLVSFPTYAIKKSKRSVYYKVGEFIQTNTPENSSIIVIGNDWSSETNYYSNRKGLAAANFISDESIEMLLKDPDAFMGNIPVSAIIYYPSKINKIIKLKNDILLKFPDMTKHKIGKSRVYIKNTQKK